MIFLARLLGDAPGGARRRADQGVDSGRGARPRERPPALHHPARAALLSTGAGSSARDSGAVHQEAATALEAWYGADAGPTRCPSPGCLAARELERAAYFAEAGRTAVVEGRTADARALFDAPRRLGRVRGRGAAHQRAEIWLDASELELAQGEDARALPLAERAARWAEEAERDASVAAQAGCWWAMWRGAGGRGWLRARLRRGGRPRCPAGRPWPRPLPAGRSLRRERAQALRVGGRVLPGRRQQRRAAGDHHGAARANRGCAGSPCGWATSARGRHLELAREASRRPPTSAASWPATGSWARRCRTCCR
ncbi:MAG: hypothetical protein R3F43_22485 [bacterium]